METVEAIIDQGNGWQIAGEITIISQINVNNITAEYNGKRYSAQYRAENSKYYIDETDPEKYSKIAAKLEEKKFYARYQRFDDPYADSEGETITRNMQRIRDIYAAREHKIFESEIQECQRRIQQAKDIRARFRSIAENARDEADYREVEHADWERMREIQIEVNEKEAKREEALIKQGAASRICAVVLIAYLVVMLILKDGWLHLIMLLGCLPLIFFIMKIINKAGE